MAFDLRSVLDGVSDLDTGRESIEYITLDKIDPDPNNFYSLSGLDELAASIETVGLQQPLRVRDGENGHVVVISGHRRRAACMLIADGGSEMFKNGVPCIRELRSGSSSLQELRLIYANSATRVLTSAEISRQAERVEALLYQLKEEGYEFPGRMRDHVAQACNVSKTKLARLHAIRENLCKGFFEQFDAGILSEAAAYELQKLPAEAQEALANEKWLEKKRGINYSNAQEAAQKFEGYGKEELTCPDKSPCHLDPLARLKYTAYSQYSYYSCSGGCCLNCYRRDGCKIKCDNAVAKDKATAAELRNAAAAREREEKRTQEKRKKDIQAECKRILPLIEKAELSDEVRLYRESCDFESVKAIRRFAEGEFEGMTFYENSVLLPRSADQLVKLCRQLNCSADFLLGLTDDPTPVLSVEAPASQWNFSSKPTEDGEYLTLDDVGCAEVLYYSTQLACWGYSYSTVDTDRLDIVCWIDIPEVEYENL